jgi:cytochrome c oxidase cbb3-type subunit III
VVDARFLPRHRALAAARLVLSACAIALAATTATSSAQSRPRPLAMATRADIAAGKQIFDAQCALCHGAAGIGGTAPDLRRPMLLHARDDEALLEVIREGIPGTPMPFAFLSLSEPMIWQTAAYVRSLGRVAPRPITGNPQHGAVLFEGNGCGRCHAIDGKGGTLGPDLSSVGIQRGAQSLRQALTDPGADHPQSFLVVTLVPRSGTEVTGIRLDEDVFWIAVRDASGGLHTVSKDTLLRVEREPKGTLMPSYDALGARDLDDLVAYLATLRGQR